MVEQIKPEVHLELSSGFFRIPTETVNYNIRVLDTGESSANTVVSQIIETETKEEEVSPVVDDFYRQVAYQFSSELSQKTESASEMAVQAMPASGVNEVVGSAIEKLNGVATKGAGIDKGLSALRESFSALKEKSSASSEVDDTKSCVEMIQGAKDEVLRAKDILAEFLGNNANGAEALSGGDLPDPAGASETKTRYLFDLDVVFQTMYELCTNETVKTHSQEARAKADTLFDKDIFLEFLSERVPSYEEDDNFLSVPIDDVLTGLINSCEDKTVVNLLRNMNKKQADIFLDQFLPLEVPATEEVGSGEETETIPDGGESTSGLERLAEANELLTKIASDLAHLGEEEDLSGKKEAAEGDNNDDGLLSEIDALLTDARAVEPSLQEVVAELEGVSSQEAGQASEGLLPELLELGQVVVSLLKQKEEKPALLFSEVNPGGYQPSKTFTGAVLGESDHGKTVRTETEPMVVEITKEIAEDTVDLSASPEESEPFEEGSVEDEDDFGEASQDDIDKLLADMS